MRENQLKRKLQQGEVVLCPFINCPYPALIEICGHAGFGQVAFFKQSEVYGQWCRNVARWNHRSIARLAGIGQFL
ncbi:hypothetical protein [Phormidium pseudopriestleyi]|uniref:hypothetical protein n=1 Tax=Phormidium pseudopriestleyi TaxID=1759527 RepID=UPI0030F3B8D6